MTRLLRLYLHDIGATLAWGIAQDRTGAPGGLAWVLTAALLCAGAGALLWFGGGHQAGFLALNQAAALLPDWLWQWLTILGDERVVFALALLFARRHPRMFWALVWAALIATAYSRGLKPLFDLPRPPAVLPADSFALIGPARRHDSFPSGHSVAAGVFFGLLIWYVGSRRWRTLFAGLALAAGLSRVAVGVHWPLDVAAGLAGGLLAVPLGVWVSGRLRRGLEDVQIHLALVTLAAFAAAGLWLYDGGYPAVALPLKVLAVLLLVTTATGYLVLPLVRAVHAARREARAAERADAPPPV